MNPEVETEYVPCDLCGSDNATHVCESIDRWHGFPGSFSVVQCRQCGLLYLNPRPVPAAISAYYPTGYYAHTDRQTGQIPTRSQSARKGLKRWIRANRFLGASSNYVPRLRQFTHDAHIRDDIDGWTPPGTVLDVGCGTGGFLDSMADSGWTTCGIEPNESAVEIARSKARHKIFCQSATDPLPHALQRACIDLIYMSHSLEHLHSPTQALRSLSTLLNPRQGRLIIEVPNLDSLLTYIFRDYGLAFDTPRHLYMFAPKTLQSLIEKTGYRVVKMRHIASPTQFVRCMKLLSQSIPFNAFQQQTLRLLSDDLLVDALQPLADFAAAKRVGGALRVVAVRA